MLRLFRLKMFSSICRRLVQCKTKVKLKIFSFDRKMLKEKTENGLRKTVYGKYFRKPFSKTKTCELNPLHLRLSALTLCTFSLSALCTFSPSPATPPATPVPSTDRCSSSLSPNPCPASRASRSPRCPSICCRSAHTRVTPTRATLSPSWSLSRTRRSPISTVPTDLPPICSFSISDPLVF